MINGKYFEVWKIGLTTMMTRSDYNVAANEGQDYNQFISEVITFKLQQQFNQENEAEE